MNKFENDFKEKLLRKPDSSWIFETNQFKNEKELEYTCYIEGPTDEDFYGNILNTSISNKKIKFISSSFTKDQTGTKDEIGKEGVIKNYFSMYKHPDFRNRLSKSIFIVDNDYEGLLSEVYDRECIDDKVFCVTPYYAFENFFLTDDNIKKIFNYFNLNNLELEKFMKVLKEFEEENSEYSRLKSSIVIACKKGRYKTYLPSCKVYVPYGKCEGEEMKPNHIFDFRFNDPRYHFFNIKFMEIKNKKMLDSVKSSPLINNYYEYETLKFVNNRNLIRGHDIYKLLEQYLLQNFRINISQSKYDKNSRYKEIVKLISVDMNFVNGLGETIH